MAKTPDSEWHTEEETRERAEAALKRMLATPHRPHSEMKIGKHTAKESAKANPPKKRGRPKEEPRE